MSFSMRSLALVFVISAVATPAARAQTTASGAEDFSALVGTRSSLIVIDDAGKETSGRLLRADRESLTMTAAGRELTFERQHVTSVYERGDSVKNGMYIGLVTGAAVGIAGGVSSTQCGGFFGARACTGGDKARLAAIGGTMLGALGMGIGVGIDALITGRRLVYDRPRRSARRTILIAPALAPSMTTLSLAVAW